MPLGFQPLFLLVTWIPIMLQCLTDALHQKIQAVGNSSGLDHTVEIGWEPVF